jgi:hypothetical protein
MVVGVVDIKKIELFLAEIARESRNITEVIPYGGGMVNLYGMVEAKLSCGFNSSF